MRTKRAILVLIAVFSLSALFFGRPRAADTSAVRVQELATVRWAGRANTHIIHPNGKVEMMRAVFEQYPKPKDVDERFYYLTISMNALARQGYEFAGITESGVVMSRFTSYDGIQ